MSQGQADLTSLQLAVNPQCNSLTAPYIATILCANQMSCKFQVLLNKNYTFPLSSVYSLPSSMSAIPSKICHTVKTTNGIQYCITNFAYNGDFTNCPLSDVTGHSPPLARFSPTGLSYSNGKLKKKMLFEAVCITDKIQLNDLNENENTDDSSSYRYYDLNYIVFITSTLDAVSIVIFLLGTLIYFIPCSMIFLSLFF